MHNLLFYLQALKEIKIFMLSTGQPDKNRQKLMRNLRVRISVNINTLPIYTTIIPKGNYSYYQVITFSVLYNTKRPFLQVIDLLVNLLQCPLGDGEEESHVIRIFKEAYDVLHAYMIGKSRKNALYMAKYIDFFQTQFTQKVSFSEKRFICNRFEIIT